MAKRPSAIVVGAGIGGVASAARLARAGFDVTVCEKNDFTGGRCSLIHYEGYRFDQGPSLLLLPRFFEEVFHDLGTTIESEGIEILKCEPNYNIWFHDGHCFSASTDLASMKLEIEKWEGEASFQHYLSFLQESHRHLELSVTHVLRRNFTSLLSMARPSFLRHILKLHPFESVYGRASRYFKSERLRRVFTFATMYIGLSPYDAPGIYSLLQYSELAEGIWYPRGGFHRIIEGLVAVGERLGVKYRLNAPIDRVTVDEQSKRATGVILSSGEQLKADVVVINADLVYATNHLLPTTPRAGRLSKQPASCSSISFYWALSREIPELQAHNVFLADEYRESFDAIFERQDMPEQPSFYVNVPSRVDKTASPPGTDAVVVLVPVGHLGGGATSKKDWHKMVETARECVISTLEARTGVTGLRDTIIKEIINTPETWKTHFNLDRLEYGKAMGRKRFTPSSHVISAIAFLDEPHKRSDNSKHQYTPGKMAGQNVVITVFPDGEYGTATAAATARNLLSTFPNITIGLMVGVGGGAPSEKHDIRLGDVVVSAPGNGEPGVFQYDYGRTIQNQAFQETQHLDKPPSVLREAVSAIKVAHEMYGHNIPNMITTALDKVPRIKAKFSSPGPDSDKLYLSTVVHPFNDNSRCDISCGVEDSLFVFRRERREDEDDPFMDYGLIATANQVMKDATIRDRLAKERAVLCFEMESGGLMNHFPCLVVRVICDYADTHKNKVWQGYAAMTAAAYTKSLLEKIQPGSATEAEKLGDLLQDVLSSSHEAAAGISNLHTSLRHDKITQWLSPPDYRQNFSTAKGKHQSGTGQWLLDSEHYKSWKTDKSSSLWLNGKTGCGKTILSYTVIADLEEDERTSDASLFFYIDFTDVEKQFTENALCSLIDQLFQWVACQFDTLETCLSPGDVEDKLKNLPETLDATYAQMMGRINPAYKHHAIRILQFLTYSERPLRIDEAVDAVTVRLTDTPRFEPRYRLEDPKMIVCYCPGFAVLVEAYDQRKKKHVIEVQLAHLSVEEYFKSDKLETDLAGYFEEVAAAKTLTEICVSYLMTLRGPTLRRQLLKQYPFAQYAAKYWSKFAFTVESCSDEVVELVKNYYSAAAHEAFSMEILIKKLVFNYFYY
ncbi:hypothetical protein NHJ13051_009173 [Beauveria bassiana]